MIQLTQRTHRTRIELDIGKWTKLKALEPASKYLMETDV